MGKDLVERSYGAVGRANGPVLPTWNANKNLSP